MLSSHGKEAKENAEEGVVVETSQQVHLPDYATQSTKPKCGEWAGLQGETEAGPIKGPFEGGSLKCCWGYGIGLDQK